MGSPNYLFIKKNVKLISTILIFFTLSGCSLFGSSGGEGSPEDYEMGDETNIPLASQNGALQDVYFSYDSSALTDSAKQTLKKNAQWLSKNSFKSVVVEGHCDERGTADYNLALGERRAKSASDYLRSLGVQSNKMSIVSYGSEIPLDPSHNEAAYAKNRRAHLALGK